MKSTHKALYNATRVLHSELDQAPVLAKLLTAELTKKQYIAALSSLYQVNRVLETSLHQFEREHAGQVGVPYQQRAELIAHDLSSFEAPLIEPETEDQFSIDSIAAYFGARYVLEGATLGSVHIAKALESLHPQLMAIAFSYWRFQQQHVSNWPAFLLTISKLDNDLVQQKDAVEAAASCFQLFIRKCR